ncbi:NTP transferase domain-containing protein [Nesterenkonia muleiensis]|uniref:NTP transferase domain-containing protein n=1 Tax=Nesterenkonia muleiensis TaxID=2282648 RepID=UPI001300841C|nr:NTP transferase domain-containing protein [Nesterenkonia muleiensis]
MPAVRAVLLAGGAGKRLGGADKALLDHGGRTLLEHWTAALADREFSGVVVGPEHLGENLPDGFLLTREDPPLAGPAAAVCAGVRALDGAGSAAPDDVVLLLAVDVVDPVALLGWLQDWLPPLSRAGEQAVVPRDAQGQFQMLSSAFRHSWLSQRVAGLRPGEETSQSLRWLLEGARTVHPILPAGLGADVDTAEDAQRLGVNRSG